MQTVRQVMRRVPQVRRMVQTTRQWTRIATAGRRPLPDFLIIGAQKSGTTSLYHYLTQFSDIRSASHKELFYFDFHYGRGEQWYRSQFPVMDADRTWITGEATPSYLSHPAVPERVAALVPEARLVALLRHPVERAYSHFHHSRAQGTESLDDFERALDLEDERVAEAWALVESHGPRRRDVEVNAYVGRSTYSPQLRRWFELFPASSLLLVTAEELFADPAQAVGRVREHLGLAPSAERIAFDKRGARAYQQMPDRVRRRMAAVFADDVAEVEQLLGRPTGWSL